MIDTMVQLRSGAIGAGGMVEYELIDGAGQRILIQARSDRADAQGFDCEVRYELALAMCRISECLKAGEDTPSAIVDHAEWGARVRHRFFVASKQMEDRARASFARKKRAYFRALTYWNGQPRQTPES
jgi:hypothetical protein